MNLAEFQDRVEAVVVALERIHERQYPLRSIPMDMVAEAVATDLAATWQVESDAAAERANPFDIATALNAVLFRNMALPKNAWQFSANPDTYDTPGLWSAGSYLPHAGVDTLRDGV